MYIFVFSSIFLHQNVFATEAGFFPPHFCICSVHSIKGFTRHEALSAIQFVSEFPVHVPFLFIYLTNEYQDNEYYVPDTVLGARSIAGI